MASASPCKASEIRKAVLAIGAGGLIAGTLDLGETLVVFGAKSPLVIAAGLLGPQNASRGGAAIYILGVLLHFSIVLSAAAIYFAASRRLHFLIEYPLICGLFFGVAVDHVMRLIVLPLSALHARGPYQYHDLVLGLVVHMVLVGLPISFSVQRFGRVTEPVDHQPVVNCRYQGNALSERFVSTSPISSDNALFVIQDLSIGTKLPSD